MKKYGIGTGYRTLAGNHVLHMELEKKLATFKHAEAAMVLTGGYMTNMAVIKPLSAKKILSYLMNSIMRPLLMPFGYRELRISLFINIWIWWIWKKSCSKPWRFGKYQKAMGSCRLF
jgi:hypothetical protein